MQETHARYVAIRPPDVEDVAVGDGRPRLTVERTIIDLVEELGRPEDLDAVIRTALRHGLTNATRLGSRAGDLASEGLPGAAAVLESLGRLGASERPTADT